MKSDAVLASLSARGMWLPHWDKPSFPKNAGDALRYIESCVGRERFMVRALQAVAVAGLNANARRTIRRYLDSATARVAALAKAFKKRHGPIAKLDDMSLQALIYCAHDMSLWRAADTRPKAYAKEKRDGETYRWITKLDVFHHARDLLCKAAADAVATPLPTQFMSKHKGGQKAFEQWLREQLPTTRRIITIDVPRCFALIRHGSVADALPLPWKVIHQAMLSPMAMPVYHWPGPKGSIPKDLQTIAQVSSSNCGIAEGSALSSVAAELVLANVLRDLAGIDDAVRVASHGDNLIILLTDATLEEHVKNVLTTSLCKHFEVMPGELAGRISSVPVSREFCFCRRRYQWVKGKLRTRLPHDNFERFEERTLVQIADARAMKDPAERNRRVAKLKRSIAGWLQQSKISPQAVTQAFELMNLLPHTLAELPAGKIAGD